MELEVEDKSPLPEELLLQKEHRQAIAEAMERLEEEFRLVLTLRVVEELPYEQIAQILDLKVGTVKSRLARARCKLKNLLEAGNKMEADSSKSTEGGMRHDM